MLRRVIGLALVVLGTSALSACTDPRTGVDPADAVTLHLESTGTGMQYCDANGACQELPYSGDCAALEITVDVETAATCQTCVMADGSTVDQGCSGTAVACVLVTLPEPDCLVCAYLNGAVLYSSCTVNPTDDCTGTRRSDGLSCEQCYDGAGRVIYDSCGPDCRDVVCPAVACAPGYVPQRLPGECCVQCVPVDNCEGVVCPMTSPVPDCPPGSMLVRDPTDCCGYGCQPTRCPGPIGLGCVTSSGCAAGSVCVAGVCRALCYSDNDCPAGACLDGLCEFSATDAGEAGAPAEPAQGCAADADCGYGAGCYGGICQPLCASSADCPAPAVCMNGVCLMDGNVPCPPGYAWREEFPYCGQCVVVADVIYCMSDAECGDGELCAFDQGLCNAGPSSGSSDPATGTTPACYGVCRPLNPDCPTASTDGTERAVAYCEGELMMQPDANGCPYPVCLCADGTVSLDGTCRNQCATMQCFAAPPTCSIGYHVDFSYPYCCGVCVPDDVCAYMQGGGNSSGIAACPDVLCAPGYRIEMGPDCCPICVRENGCASDRDCLYGETCTAGLCVRFREDCVDSDFGIDIFTPGYATGLDAAGATVTVADRCSDDGLSVIETYCYETAAGGRVERVSVKCPAVGCVANGDQAACWTE